MIASSICRLRKHPPAPAWMTRRASTKAASAKPSRRRTLRRATRLLNEWQGIDPGNLRIPAVRDQLAAAQAAIATTAAPTPAPEATPAPQATPDAAALRNDANAAEQSGSIEEAIAIWEKVRAIPSLPEDQLAEATAAVTRLKQQLYADVQPTGESAGLSPLVLGGIGAAVLVLIVVVILVLKKKKASAIPAPPDGECRPAGRGKACWQARPGIAAQACRRPLHTHRAPNGKGTRLRPASPKPSRIRRS
jgi:hypothetical protein